MPCRLTLMRHAKSAWDAPAPSDHERPLNNRGQRSAAALGDWLRTRGWLPDEVLCSTAVRTRETLAGLQVDAPVQFIKALYHAAPDTLLGALQQVRTNNVLIIAHNPGIAICAGALVSTPPVHDRFDDFPTGATLVMEFPIDSWAKLVPGTGTALDFVVPRELPGV